jgi:hypothetical protein
MEKSSRTASAWIALAAVVYASLVLWAEKAHTFWRDEAEVWIVARDSHSLLNLLHNVRYEGHPPAWYWVIYCITHFTWNPAWMKLPNVLFAIAAALLILTFTRAALWVRLGIIFSYFLLFEYAVIDRNYMMGVMLLLLALRLIAAARGPLALSITLGLAALTSVPAAVLAVCLFLLQFTRPSDRRKHWRTYLGAAIFALCLLAALLEVRPPKDSGLMMDSLPRQGLAKTLVHPFHDIAKGYLPRPSLQVAFWDTNLIDAHSQLAFTLIGLALAAALVFFFRGRVRLFFLAASALLLLQMVVSRRTDDRHVGWLFIVFLLALLLRHIPSLDDPQSQPSTWRTALLAALLTVQVIAGIFAVTVSARHTFSGSAAAAAYLRDHNLNTAPIVFAPDFVSLAPLAYLERPNAYYVESHTLGSIVVWNKQEHLARHVPTPAELQAASPDGTKPVLITEKPLTDDQLTALGIKPLALFSGEIGPDHYFIYR